MRTLVDTLYELWFDTQHILKADEMSKILSSLTATLSSVKKGRLYNKENSDSYLAEEQKNSFLQMWFLIAVYHL